MTAVELKSLSCSLGGGGRTLFQNLSARFERGEFVCVVGPNGAGKSTLLKTIANLGSRQSGSVKIEGKDASEYGKRQFARLVSYLPQSTPLYHDMLVKDLVVLGRAPYLERLSIWSDEDYQKVDYYLDAVGLGGVGNRPIFSLSGGEFQRVMLARMLTTEADILILDEPVTAVDIRYSLEFLRLCSELCSRNKLILMAIHDLELARRYSHKILCLGGDQDGGYRLGSPQEVFTKENIESVFGVSAMFHKNGFLLYPKGEKVR